MALQIPWQSPSQPFLAYVDLKKHPDAIKSLKECRGNPSLARLLHRINSPGLPFRTAKCDAWTTIRPEDDEREYFQLPQKAGGYVDLVFESPLLQSRIAAHLHLAKELEKALAGYPLAAQVVITIRRCFFHSKKKWGYGLTLFVDAFGRTRYLARGEWGRALDLVGDALFQAAPFYVRERGKRLDPHPRVAI